MITLSLNPKNAFKKLWTAWLSIFDGNTIVNQNQKHNTNSPFRIVEHPEHGWYVLLGECILTTGHTTKKEAEEAIDITDYNFLVTLISAIQHLNTRIKNEENGN